MTPDLYWIPGPWRGRLAIAARPRGGDWLADEARGWREAGIDIMVSLLELDEAAQLNLTEEATEASANGIRFLSFPIPDRGVPASRSAAASLLATISNDLEAGSSVAIHCRQSIGRSGMVAAALLASSGIDAEQAIETVSFARGLNVPETADQRRWVQRLVSRPPAVAH